MTQRTRSRYREPYTLDEPQVSLGDLASRIAEDAGILVRDHIQLAKIEMTNEAKKAGVGAGLLGGAGVAGWLAAVILSMSAAWGLAELIESVWIGFLIVGLLWVVVALVLAVIGRNRLREVEPKPEQTIHEIREDKRWINRQTN